ncbi:hypothetical protein GH808_14915, partial [Acetobacterium fimetarium]
PVADNPDTDSVQTAEITEDTLDTSATRVFPDDYPSGYYSYTTEARVDGAGAVELVEKMNALRVSLGRQPLVLDGSLTKAAMYRASEINLVYLHKAPAGNAGNQPDYRIFSGSSENIVIGRNSGAAAYSAFEGSGGHYVQMTHSWYTRVGVGHYGNAWVLSFNGDFPDMSNLTPQDLISTYTTNSKVIRTVVDQTNTDGVAYNGEYPCYRPHPCVDSSYKQTTNLSIDKGVSRQMKAFVVPAPYEDWIEKYRGLEVKIVPSSVTWSSSNPSIASVDTNGVVTGKTTGTTVISTKVGEDTLTYNITVTGNGTMPPDLGNYLVKYRTHVENVGWQSYVTDGSKAGTEGRSLRLEGINIDLNEGMSGGIEYRTHVQDIGWQNYVANNVMAGTEGRCLRLEAINIRLTGEAATKYDIYYRVHTQNIGWMGWAKNDEPAGSAGFSYRLEGIEIQLVQKGSPAPGSTVNAFVENK